MREASFGIGQAPDRVPRESRPTRCGNCQNNSATSEPSPWCRSTVHKLPAPARETAYVPQPLEAWERELLEAVPDDAA